MARLAAGPSCASVNAARTLAAIGNGVNTPLTAGPSAPAAVVSTTTSTAVRDAERPERADYSAVSTISSRESRFYTGPVRWLLAPAQDDLEGFEKIDWSRLHERWIEPARKVNMRRKSLDSAAQDWLDWLGKVDRLAVTGVCLSGAEVAADLLGFVVEPAVRIGIELVIGADRELEQLDPAEFVEAEFGYAYSLERLLWLLRGERPSLSVPARVPDPPFAPDETQTQAILAGEGVVQIIAPAGSGKTSVLVQRVRELRLRGAPAEAITCLTFNRAAREELQERLVAAGLGGVKAWSFHALGRHILIQAKRLPRDPNIGGPSQGQWRMLAYNAMREAGEDVWLDPADAQHAVSDVKLGRLMRAGEYAATLTEDSSARERTVAALYAAYEKLQHESERRVDFDDMILLTVLLLREDSAVRARWQSTYQYLLVDEYQDIEPAQELMVRLIAAPQDQLFCVGDEDQTLYAFRRASVERIICLDGPYPGLERVALGVNYRCPASVVAASRRLIEHNKVRFSKAIAPASEDGSARGSISLRAFQRKAESAVQAAQALRAGARGEIVVLARTTDALRPAALACADMDIPIDGPKKLFEPQGARRALGDHLRLALHPLTADRQLVQSVCQMPGRSLHRGAAEGVAQRLQASQPFDVAFAGIAAPKRGGGKLLSPGELFAELAACDDGAAAIALLRGAGGLDEWFLQADGMAGLDQFECEVLEQAERDAAGLPPRAYLQELELQAARLKASRDPQLGIELNTIHGAKGRQWPHVILLACEEGTMPHKRSLEATSEEIARGEGPEAERRLGYVAFTRAQEVLEIHYDSERPSRFLTEAGLIRAPAKEARQARKPPPPPGLDPAEGLPSLRVLLKRLMRGD
jgi:superfamily I DNA/RNA helicase